MTFIFEVVWSVGGSVEVEAESLEEARGKAASLNPCDVGNAIYVGDSWCVEESEEDLTTCCGQTPVVPDFTADLACPQCGEVL